MNELSLEEIEKLSASEGLPLLIGFVATNRARLTSGLALRSVFMRRLAESGWSHGDIALASDVSVATVRAVLR